MYRAFARAVVLASLLACVLVGPGIAQERSSWGKVKADYRGATVRSVGSRSAAPNAQVTTPDDGPQYSSAGGDSQNLPVGPQYGSQTLINWALTMPAVQTAQAIFDARGYIRNPSGDRGVSIAAAKPVSVVYLSYSRPGGTAPGQGGSPPAQFAMAPTVTVVSELDPSTGSVLSKCGGGVLYLDPVSNTVMLTDDVPAFATSDPSFDIVDAGGSSGGDPGIIRTGPFAATHDPWHMNKTEVKKFVEDTVGGFVGCVSGTVVGVGVATGGLGDAAFMTPPGAAGLAVGCLAAGADWGAIDYWLHQAIDQL